MAEDFQPSSWWNTSNSRNSGVDVDSSQSIASPSASSFSCSTSINDAAGAAFSWSSATHEIPEAKQLSCFGFSNTLSTDWNQTLLRNSGRAENSFNAMLQEDLSSRHELGEPSSMSISSKDMNQPFLFSSSASSSSSMLQGVIESDSRFQQQLFDGQQMASYQPQVIMANYQRVSSDQAQQQASWNQSSQLFKGLPHKQQIAVNQLQFTNSIPPWNASSGFYSSSSLSPFEAQIFETKPVFETKPSSSVIAKSTGGAREKKISSEASLKKPRIETTSSLPAFKVRKEKLGDRITALQQLVSPFGKTDTASVLHEAIEYIKFLHDQVSALSSPYLKNGHPMQQQQNPDKYSEDEEEFKHYLRSRGLCLVPVASTYPMAGEATSDFWTPTFGRTYM